MTIVLDTNCLIQILPRQAEYRWLYDSLQQGKIKLALTTEVLLEYEETINLFYGSKTLGTNVTSLLLDLPQTKKIDIYYR